MCVDESTWDKG